MSLLEKPIFFLVFLLVFDFRAYIGKHLSLKVDENELPTCQLEDEPQSHASPEIIVQVLADNGILKEFANEQSHTFGRGENGPRNSNKDQNGENVEVGNKMIHPCIERLSLPIQMPKCRAQNYKHKPNGKGQGGNHPG